MKDEEKKDDNKNSFIKHCGEVCPVISLLAILFLLVGPMEIYGGNLQEFNFEIGSFLGLFLVAFFLVIIIGTVGVSILPEKIRTMVVMLLFAFGIMAYVQNMFMNQNIFNADGSRVDWNGLKSATVGNTIIWILGLAAIIALLLVLKKQNKKIMKWTSAFIVAIQLVSVVTLLISAVTYTRVNNNYILSGEHEFELARGNNIVVLLLDRYANDEFEDLLSKDASYRNTFADFTYYSNADSHYNYTFPSMAHMVTGQEIDRSLAREEWTKQIWENQDCQNFYARMHEAGYTCNIFSDVEAYVALGSLDNLNGKFDNVVECEPRIDKGLICRLLEKMTIYKFAPFLIKPKFEVDYNVFQQTVIYDREDGTVAFDNGMFYEQIREQGLDINEDMENAYSFIHLSGLHSPYHTAADGTYVEESSKKESKLGIQVMIQEYLEQLDKAGKYEDTTIIITSDHGMSHAEREPQPLFLVKMAGESHEEMQETSAPISHDDFLATILEIAGIKEETDGTSIFDWQDGDVRQRELWYPYSDKEIQCYVYEGDREVLKQKMDEKEFDLYETSFDWHW